MHQRVDQSAVAFMIGATGDSRTAASGPSPESVRDRGFPCSEGETLLRLRGYDGQAAHAPLLSKDPPYLYVSVSSGKSENHFRR